MERTNLHINQQNASNPQAYISRSALFQNHPNLLIRDCDESFLVDLHNFMIGTNSRLLNILTFHSGHLCRFRTTNA